MLLFELKPNYGVINAKQLKKLAYKGTILCNFDVRMTTRIYILALTEYLGFNWFIGLLLFV